MSICFFVSDLHGRVDRYEKLFSAIRAERPEAVFLGGDLLPNPMAPPPELLGKDFLSEYFAQRLRTVHADPGPRIFAILGNDDGRGQEEVLRQMEADGLLHYVHGRWEQFGSFSVLGYSYVPPTPFLLKDWERYDVSRFVDPGAISPEEGFRQIEIPAVSRST